MINILTHLFYLSTAVYMIHEIHWLVNLDEQVDETNRFIKLSEENRGRSFKHYSEDYKEMLSDKWNALFIFFWMFIGLFTTQWEFFLMNLLFNICIIAPLSDLTRYTKAYKIIHWINSLIGFLFCIFVIINHYHLHIKL